MVTTDKVLAVIPARGGSKSIPGKNIKMLAGHPLIAYSIAAGLQARRVGRVVVSTDDAEIARIAKALGAEVPFLRPPELSGDAVTDLPVLRHALQTLEDSESYRPDIVVHLRPTSPLRPRGAVDEAVRILAEDPGADSVRSVCGPSQNPYKMWRLDKGCLKPLLRDRTPEPYNAPRQSLPEVLWQTGQVDAVRRATVMDKGSVSGERILPMIMDAAWAVDLDTPAQWELAERLARTRINDRLVAPEKRQIPVARRIRLVVSDFDGVLTDNRVWISQDGRESVACSREDGLGIERLQASGIPFVIISSEGNPVVSERARKLKARCFQRVRCKADCLKKVAAEHALGLEETAYVGNDLNDLGALQAAGLAVAVPDADPAVLEEVDWVLNRPGGRGAVRELCDLILTMNGKENT